MSAEDPERSFLARRDLAVAYLAMGRIEDAIRELELALTIRPDDHECRVLLIEAKNPPVSPVGC